MPGGGQRSTTTSTPTPANIPPELVPLVNTSVDQTIQAQAFNPLGPYTASHPQGVPGLTADQQMFLGQTEALPGQPSPFAPFMGEDPSIRQFAGENPALAPLGQYAAGAAAASGDQYMRLLNLGPYSAAETQALTGTEALIGKDPLTSYELDAASELKKFTGGPLGESPATRAGMAAFDRLVGPRIASSHALQGNLGGGGYTEDVALASTAAALPLLQDEERYRFAAIPELERLGATSAGRTRGDLATLFQEGSVGSDRARGDIAQEAKVLQEQAGFAEIPYATTAADLARRTGVTEADLARRTGVAGAGAELLRADLGKGLDAATQFRDVAGQLSESDYRDFLRRQALSEAAVLGPLGEILPSALRGGQTSTTKGSGGGLLGSVICTELHRQGRMDDATYAADTAFGRAQDTDVIAGYHAWAPAVVRAMRRSRFVARGVALVALPWAREMERRQTGRGAGSWLGAALMAVGVPLCRAVGRARRVWAA